MVHTQNRLIDCNVSHVSTAHLVFHGPFPFRVPDSLVSFDRGLKGCSVPADLAEVRLLLLVTRHHVVPKRHVRLGHVTTNMANLGLLYRGSLFSFWKVWRDQLVKCSFRLHFGGGFKFKSNENLPPPDVFTAASALSFASASKKEASSALPASSIQMSSSSSSPLA